MNEIIEASNKNQFKEIEKLARLILPEVYDPIIPNEHTQFFIEKFQTSSAIEIQIKNEDFKYYILKHFDINAGYLGIQISKEKVVLSKLYILKDYRGKKLGKTALDLVDKTASELSIPLIQLIVNRQNQNTIDIYKKRGYRIIDSLVHSFENGHSVEDYKMEKNLEIISQ